MIDQWEKEKSFSSGRITFKATHSQITCLHPNCNAFDATSLAAFSRTWSCMSALSMQRLSDGKLCYSTSILIGDEENVLTFFFMVLDIVP